VFIGRSSCAILTESFRLHFARESRRLRLSAAAHGARDGLAAPPWDDVGQCYFFGSIFGANVWTAILPFLIRNVSAANTMFADAQFACHTT